jgi:hypothetical protein
VQLSEAGESRLNGYLFVLQRSLVPSLSRDLVADAVREIESHVRDRVAAAEPIPDERTALEQILMELGPPLRVAQAYAAERAIDEAITTGRVIAVLRAVGQLATTTVIGFFAAILIVMGYIMSVAGLAIAIGKILFPEHTGFWYRDGYDGVLGRWPSNLAIISDPLPGEHPAGGYWVVLIGLIVAVGFFVVTQRGARRFLSWWRGRGPAKAGHYAG